MRVYNIVLATTLIGLSLFSVRFAYAENYHISAALRETMEAIVEGKQHMFPSFSEHTHNALDHTEEAIFDEKDLKGHVKIAKSHLSKAIKITKHTNNEFRLAKGIREAEKALMHLKLANEQ